MPNPSGAASAIHALTVRKRTEDRVEVQLTIAEGSRQIEAAPLGIRRRRHP
jgi:hypothetical protein